MDEISHAWFTSIICGQCSFFGGRLGTADEEITAVRTIRDLAT